MNERTDENELGGFVISTCPRARRERRHRRHAIARSLTHAALAAGLLLAAAAASAEQAWIKAELTLNLRTGPGTQYRILDAVKSGDLVTILERAESWTHVRLAEGKDGWIPAGYQPPPTLRLVQLEEEVVELRGQLETVTADREQLRSSNESLASNDDEQATRIAELTQENMRLTAGQRWPEWITGGAMVAIGMILGALWSRSAGRRSSPRIRL